VSERARSSRRSGRARSRHFLRTRFAAELVRDAAVRPDELVVDLGAGSGRLTSELAGAARRVVAVELDAGLAERLRGRWPNVAVIHADARSCSLPREEFRVVANLPFRGTNEILRHLLDDPRVPLTRADLVVQWGVAVKRALPWPSTVNGVVWGAWWTIRAARRLPPQAFEPPPSVDAGVLVFERRPDPLVAVELAAGYRRFVARGFRSRHRARELDAHEWAARYLEGLEVSRCGSASRGARPGRASPRPRRR
jgi:23S rRNA (adenine-N6)-dimethyltransferase